MQESSMWESDQDWLFRMPRDGRMDIDERYTYLDPSSLPTFSVGDVAQISSVSHQAPRNCEMGWYQDYPYLPFEELGRDLGESPAVQQTIDSALGPTEGNATPLDTSYASLIPPNLSADESAVKRFKALLESFDRKQADQIIHPTFDDVKFLFQSTPSSKRANYRGKGSRNSDMRYTCQWGSCGYRGSSQMCIEHTFSTHIKKITLSFSCGDCSRGFIRKFDLDRHKRSYCHISKSRNDIQARASSHPYLRETPNELSKPRPDRMKVLKTLSESPMIFGEAFDIGEDKDKDKDKVLDKDKEAKALDYQSSPLSESDYKRRSFTNNIIWPQFGLNDKVEAGAYSATRGLTQTQVPGSLGQFQTHLVKPLIRFMMMPYLRAQRTLHLARNVHVFHMQSIYVARQALHLVILLNDQVNPHTGPSDEQYKERITLEDELIHLIQDMKAWGFSQEMEERIHKIEENYVQFFRERFYFHTPRILRDDPVYQKALEYDKHTIEMRKFQQWKLGHCEVINDSQRMSLDDQQDDYSEAFIESVANSPAENVPVSSPHEHHYPRFAQNSDTDSQDTTLSPPVAVQVSNQRRRYRCIVCNSSFDRQSRADECRNNDLGIRPYECAGSWGDERCLIDGHSVATSSPSITPASHQLFTPSTPGEQFAAPPLHLPASPHQFTSLSSTFTSASPIKFVNQTTHYATVSATAHSDDPISSGPHESEDSRLRKRRRVLLTDAEDESDEKRLDDIPVKSELRPPKQAPSMWQLYFADWLQDHKARQPQNKLNIAQAAKEAGQIYKTLSAEAKEDLKKRVQQEKESRERRLAAWQRTLTPADIKRENKFRAAQRKAGLSRRANIKDPNSPKKPLSAYFLFLARIRSDPLLVDEVFGGETETTRQSVLAAQRWREMSDVEKKPFLTQAEHDKIQYDALRKVYEEKANMGSCSPARKQMTGTGYIVPQHSGTSEEPTAATMSDRSSMSESHAIMVAYEPEATISAGKTNTRATPMPMPVFSSSTRTIRQRAARKTARLPGGGDGLARSYPHAADSGAESADSDDEWVPGKSI